MTETKARSYQPSVRQDYDTKGASGYPLRLTANELPRSKLRGL